MYRSCQIVTSEGLNHVREINRILREPHLSNRYSRDFQNFDKGQKKMSSQIWIVMAVEVVYILCNYVFGLYFVP